MGKYWIIGHINRNTLRETTTFRIDVNYFWTPQK